MGLALEKMLGRGLQLGTPLGTHTRGDRGELVVGRISRKRAVRVTEKAGEHVENQASASGTASGQRGLPLLCKPVVLPCGFFRLREA